MAVLADVNWKDLETRGFVHIPAFLSASQLETCSKDYLEQPLSTNRNYALSNVTQRVVDCARGSIREVLGHVLTRTDIKADLYLGASYFATKRGIVFNWHQDHESYFLTQNHYDYLNFYIPIMKPQRDKSNLCIVPFDVLERESPEMFRHVARSGAATCHAIGRRQILVHDDSGSLHAGATTFDGMAVTPQLEAGDLLLLRGDILHKTQDEDTSRVALSIRLGCSKTVVRRAALADGGRAKARMMARNLASYQLMFEAFDALGADEAPLMTLVSMMNEQGRTRQQLPIIDHPRRYILKQKARSGVLLSSARKAAGELIWNPVVEYYYRRQGNSPVRAGQPEPRRT